MVEAPLTVSRSDLDKIHDALVAAAVFFQSRDEMNAAVHLGQPRYSPLTVTVQAAEERANALLDGGS